MKHTSTPWRIERETSNIIAGIDNKEIRVLTVNGAVDDEKIDLANAAFIVRAVNAHGELVQALREIESMAEDNRYNIESHAEIKQVASRAIDKAEGRV
jgi:hypothetical protein